MRRLVAAAIFLTASAVAGVCAPFGIVVASVYGPHDSGGQINSFGRRIDYKAMTVAHKTLPLGTRVMIYRGRDCAEVRVTDRGPFKRGREFDLTLGVAKALHFSGVGRIRVEPFPPLPRERKVP